MRAQIDATRPRRACLPKFKWFIISGIIEANASAPSQRLPWLTPRKAEREAKTSFYIVRFHSGLRKNNPQTKA
jgi:hypothetical protein